MTLKVLLDSDALIAIAKPDDSNHDKALQTIYKNKNLILYTTCFSITESSTVISYKVSQDAAAAFLNQVRKSNFKSIDYSAELEELADKIFVAQKNKGTSWFDCFNLAAYKSLKLDAIFSFDKFYAKAGAKLLAGY